MKVDRRLAAGAMVVTGFLTLLAFRTQPVTAKTAEADWLPLCGKCMTPTIFSKSGIGTAHAVAEARVTYKNAKDHCEQWSMAANPDCDKQAKESVQEEKGKIYKAIADCVHGKITLATGDNLTYAGVWSNGELKGKTRWRFVSLGYDNGQFANENGPVNGFMVDVTSKILCPNGVGTVRKR